MPPDAVRGSAVDCHVHVFGSSRDVPAPRVPHPERAAALKDVTALGAALGFRRYVLTQPSFLGFDNSHMLATVATNPDSMRAVAWLPPSTDPGDLVALAASGVVGLRFPLKYASELPDWDAYAALFAAAAARGIHVELGLAGVALIAAARKVLAGGASVVVAHLGMFDAAVGPDKDPAFAALLELAATRKVWVKLSAPYRAPRPFADRACAQLLGAFGPDRAVWGSDWPHVAQQLDRRTTYPASLDWLRDRVPDARILRQILVASPAALYGFT
ncbi:amidohydrolase family protein [Dongia sedimenti]|uniref:Amidohydrolase family protein n=1 Tax=Dongia sedimenti TaxID=3064282 RepID=A0ABU0YVX9_9PROT|nr:amidohydrolase family protein [Rhodospirillaceae bacterium R-7]